MSSHIIQEFSLLLKCQCALHLHLTSLSLSYFRKNPITRIFSNNVITYRHIKCWMQHTVQTFDAFNLYTFIN